MIFGVDPEEKNKILIEDLKRQKTMVELEGHSENILSLRHSKKFNKLYSGSMDKIMIKWDLNTYRKEHVFDNFHSGDIQNLILLSEDRLLVSGSKDKFVNLFETKTCLHVGTVKFETSVLCFAKDQEETKIFCAGKDTQDLKAWTLASILEFCKQQVGSLRKIVKGAGLKKLKLLNGDYKQSDIFGTNLKRDKYEFGENFEVMDSMDEKIFEKKLNKDMNLNEVSISNNIEEDQMVNVNKELDQIYKLLEQNKEVIIKESVPTLGSLEIQSKPNSEQKGDIVSQLKIKVTEEREKTKELREDIVKLNEDLLEKFTEIKDEQNGTIEKIIESNIVQFGKDEMIMKKLENFENIMKLEKQKPSYQKKELKFKHEILKRELGN